MAAIAHAFTEVNTPQTTTSTVVVDIPGASIAYAGNFTAGKKYLIVVTAQMSSSTVGQNIAISTLHGTTNFTNAFREAWIVNADDYTPYGFMTVWTAVADEGIKLQYRIAGVGTMTADQISMFAMNLSDNLVENTDWFFNQNGTSTGLTTAFAAGATVTFTPAVASQDWLVLVWSAIDNNDIATNSLVRIARSGEATSTDPTAIKELADVNADPGYFLARVYTLGAASNTFSEEAATSSGTGHTHLQSTVFALNLNKFAQHNVLAYTAADEPLSATNYATLLQSASITPSVAGDVWIIGYFGFDKNDDARKAEFRIQADNADQPSGQTTDNRQFSAGSDAGNVEDCYLSTLVSLTAAAHTIDLDASSDSTISTPNGRHRTLMAVTMEQGVTTTAVSGLVDGGMLLSLTRGGLVG